jgi:hypothetical protein
MTALLRKQWRDAVTASPTSWRPYGHTPWWDEYDVVISSEGGGSGRRAYEVYVGGRIIATRPRLDEAQEAAEGHCGCSLHWTRRRLEDFVVDHPFFGPTTEFTSPTTIWTADLQPVAGVRTASLAKLGRVLGSFSTQDECRAVLGFQGVDLNVCYRAMSLDDIQRVKNEGVITSDWRGERYPPGSVFAAYDPGTAPYALAKQSGRPISRIEGAKTRATYPGEVIVLPGTPASCIKGWALPA